MTMTSDLLILFGLGLLGLSVSVFLFSRIKRSQQFAEQRFEQLADEIRGRAQAADGRFDYLTSRLERLQLERRADGLLSLVAAAKSRGTMPDSLATELERHALELAEAARRGISEDNRRSSDT